MDCDVLQADGGTRTASITGGCLALVDAIGWMRQSGLVSADPIVRLVASVSVGIVSGTSVLDLDYAEDSSADTDMNVVATDSGHFIEVQGTAEGAPYSRDELLAMLDLADIGTAALFESQRRARAP